jgi:hypothetical protein
MTRQTPTFKIPYPEGTDIPDVPRDMEAMATAIDGLLGSTLKMYWADAPWSTAGHVSIAWKLPHVTHKFAKFTAGTPGWAADGLVVPNAGLYLIGGSVSLASSGVTFCGVHLTKVYGDNVLLQASNGDVHTVSARLGPKPVQLTAGEKLQVEVRPIGSRAGNVLVRACQIYALKLSPTVVITSPPSDPGLQE